MNLEKIWDWDCGPWNNEENYIHRATIASDVCRFTLDNLSLTSRPNLACDIYLCTSVQMCANVGKRGRGPSRVWDWLGLVACARVTSYHTRIHPAALYPQLWEPQILAVLLFAHTFSSPQARSLAELFPHKKYVNCDKMYINFHQQWLKSVSTSTAGEWWC